MERKGKERKGRLRGGGGGVVKLHSVRMAVAREKMIRRELGIDNRANKGVNTGSNHHALSPG